mmetsp:Transcript_14106/g.20859  ORF Transcript_14106/g.20859 Transcript_14106/m.20859 type:complete len:181 (+) Transcript_14106:23-565(+)
MSNASKGLLRRIKRLQAPRTPYQPSLDEKNLIPLSKWIIVRGDMVEMISGIEEGKQGVVQKVIRKTNRLIVEGFNMKQVTLPQRNDSPEREVIRPEPVHLSNVSLVCPETGQRTRAVRRYLEDGSRVRIAKVSGAVIPRPSILTQRKQPKSLVMGPKDTELKYAHEITFRGLDENGNERE